MMHNVVEIKINSQNPNPDPCNSIKERIPKTYQDDLKARLIEGREGVHSVDTLPRALRVSLVEFRHRQ